MLFCKNPKVSYVVIAYNREAYINECIDSILAQNIEKEIICIDDCSIDATYSILKNYARKHSEVKLYKNDKNMGTVYSRTKGMSKCSGEYMLFVDSDDKVIGNHVELYKHAKETVADILEFSCETDGDKNFQNVLKRANAVVEKDLLSAYQNKVILNQLWNKLISKRVYKKVVKLINTDVKQTNFSDVVFFMYHYIMNAQKFVSTDKVGYFYYDNRGMTANLSKLDRLREYCGFKRTKKELESVYWKSDTLKTTWNYVCNQAVVCYLSLSKQEQEENKYILYELMSQKNVDFLINALKDKMS